MPIHSNGIAAFIRDGKSFTLMGLNTIFRPTTKSFSCRLNGTYWMNEWNYCPCWVPIDALLYGRAGWQNSVSRFGPKVVEKIIRATISRTDLSAAVILSVEPATFTEVVLSGDAYEDKSCLLEKISIHRVSVHLTKAQWRDKYHVSICCEVLGVRTFMTNLSKQSCLCRYRTRRHDRHSYLCLNQPRSARY